MKNYVSISSHTLFLCSKDGKISRVCFVVKIGGETISDHVQHEWYKCCDDWHDETSYVVVCNSYFSVSLGGLCEKVTDLLAFLYLSLTVTPMFSIFVYSVMISVTKPQGGGFPWLVSHQLPSVSRWKSSQLWQVEGKLLCSWDSVVLALPMILRL